MINIIHDSPKHGATLVAAAVAAILLAACAATPSRPDGSAEVRAKLTRLQSDPQLATRAPLAMRDAEAAVVVAEQPQPDVQLANYRVYVADRKIDVAMAQAETSLAVDERAALIQQRDLSRLNERTREADAANHQLAKAQVQIAEQAGQAAADRAAVGAAQNSAADANAQSAVANNQLATARVQIAAQADQATADRAAVGAAQNSAADANAQSDAANNRLANARERIAEQQDQAAVDRAAVNAAQNSAADAAAQSADLQHQLDELHARPTDHGLVLTLGDTLFTSGKADLKTGATSHLSRLVVFLNKYPGRSVSIEGYTDSIGGDDYNLGLSQRRADAVKSYLIDQGIDSSRLSAIGRGNSEPVAGNETPSGRQQNRRVELVISSAPVASR
jgi:outer membrane protein OmpA-like peptidoglycan-associated protein